MADANWQPPAAPPPTTPTEVRPHGGLPRGLLSAPRSSQESSRFGRMFRRLPVYEVSDASLIVLAAAMIQATEEDESGQPMLDKALGSVDEDENTSVLSNGQLRLPAGYTYFGQFVDHDITFDPASSLTRQNDPNALVNFRTPAFDLDNLYGKGPSDDPYLYDADGLKLREGIEVGPDGLRDLPRALQVGAVLAGDGSEDDRFATLDRALIGDPRNDENRVIGQLQATLIRFHNAVVDWVAINEPGLATEPENHFKRAQQLVRWHYQWVVVHDFLPRIVGDDPFLPDAGVVASILKEDIYETLGGPQGVVRPKLLFYRFRDRPYMPVEFSVAVYRFGHSMVRPSYEINEFLVGVRPKPGPVPGRPGVQSFRIPVFTQTNGRIDNLNGFQPLADQWGVEWRFFLHLEDTDDNLPQPSYKIDAQLVQPLGFLPDSVAKAAPLAGGFKPEVAKSLAARNLLRGRTMSLPSGEDVAHAMGITPDPGIVIDAAFLQAAQVTDPDITQDQIDTAIADLSERTPLWFYILKEAELLGKSTDAAGQEVNGAHLGPVGARIVAEVLIGLLSGDQLSFLSVQPDWEPQLPRRDGSTTGKVFTLADLIHFATSS